MPTLAAICLNEEEFIAAWLGYHYNSFDRIILCEGAARGYPVDAVTADGLSLDRTAEIIQTFPDPDHKIEFIQYGWAGTGVSSDDRVPAKMELRNVYASLLEDEFVFTLDVDEFLHPFYVRELVDMLQCHPEVTACAVPQLHLWQNTRQYITGGYANVPHYRLYRWTAGSRYLASHNFPSNADGELLTHGGVRPKIEVENGKLIAPAIIHYGFCERKSEMTDKNSYYLVRGEEATRPSITQFRAAALAGSTPDGCVVHPYTGYLPFP